MFFSVFTGVGMFATVASCSLLLPLLKMRKQKRRRCRIDVGGRRMHGNIKDGQADGLRENESGRRCEQGRRSLRGLAWHTAMF